MYWILDLRILISICAHHHWVIRCSSPPKVAYIFLDVRTPWNKFKNTTYVWSHQNTPVLHFVWYFYNYMRYKKSERYFLDKTSLHEKSQVRVRKWSLVAELKLKMFWHFQFQLCHQGNLIYSLIGPFRYKGCVSR